MATSILQGLGSLGSDIGTGQEINRQQRIKDAQLQLAQLQAAISKQYGDIAGGRLKLEQQQAGMPKYKGLTPMGDKAIIQNPDGSLKMVDIAPGGEASLFKAAESAIGTLKDPVRQQRARDLFMGHVAVGDIKGGYTALQQQIAQESTEERTETHQKVQQTFSKEQQTRAQTFSRTQQDRAFAEREKIAKMGYAEREKLLQAKKPAVTQGLNVLHVSLFGSKGTPGLDSEIGVLDSTASRLKLIAAKAGQTPDPKQWTISRLMEAGMYKSLSPEEKRYVYQLNRAISAINGLRSITGLPRSTQALMDRYIMELPDPVTTPSSADARNKLALIEREIRAALSDDELTKALQAEAGGTTAPNAPAAPADTGVPGEEEEP